MANKTPAMILQELSIKRCGRAPDFTLITQNQGTHENEFEYLVSVLNISATGRGRSKKEAKQETAKNALVILNERLKLDSTSIFSQHQQSSQQLSPDEAELPQVVNYIGYLGDLCLVNNLPTPEYVLILDDGPAHHKVFTYQCRLGHSLITKCTASTKKLARQNVAKMMLERIQDIVPALSKEQENERLKLCDKDVEAVDRYHDLSTVIQKSNLYVRINDYHLHLMKHMEEKNVSFDDIKMFFELPHSEEKMKQLLNRLELELETVDLTEEENSEHHIISMGANTIVPLCTLAAGSTEEIAKQKALNDLFRQVEVLATAKEYGKDD